MANSAQAAKGVDNMDLWADSITSNRYPTAESACLGNATWINSHPSYGYTLSLASINAPALPTGNWSCLYSGVLLDKNHTPMPFPAANMSIYRYYYCPANAHVIAAASNQLTGGVCECNTNFHADLPHKSCEPDILTLTLSNAPAGNIVTLASQPMSLQVTNNATPPDLNTATYIRVEISQPSVNGGTVIPARLTGCPIVSNSGTTSVYNCYTGYPDGYLNGIAKFGYANFNYTAPSIPGSYSLTATCTNPLCANSQSATINVICPAGTQLNAAGTACVEAFSLTLNAPAGDLEPSGTAAGNLNSSKAMSVFVKSEKTGLAKSGAVVRVVLNALPNAGGSIPTLTTITGCAAVSTVTGGYDCTTSATGYANFNFIAPSVTGSHTVTATCTTPLCVSPQSATVNVITCAAGQKLHPIKGCMLDCSAQPGTYPNLDDTACVPDSAPNCDIKPMMPLPIESTDQCTAALENPSYTQAQKDAVCGTITPAMQQEKACLIEKMARPPYNITMGNTTAEVRSMAYQAHFRDIWDKMEKVMDDEVQLNPAMQAACAPRRAELAAEKGCDHAGQCDKKKYPSDCASGSGKRNHCFVGRPAEATNAAHHALGRAIDIPSDDANALVANLLAQTPRKTVEQFLLNPGTADPVTKTPTVCPASPQMKWGGYFKGNKDKVHFYLP